MIFETAFDGQFFKLTAQLFTVRARSFSKNKKEMGWNKFFTVFRAEYTVVSIRVSHFLLLHHLISWNHRKPHEQFCSNKVRVSPSFSCLAFLWCMFLHCLHAMYISICCLYGSLYWVCVWSKFLVFLFIHRNSELEFDSCKFYPETDAIPSHSLAQ